MFDAAPPDPGFTTSGSVATTPLVLASPHSGRAYPPAFRAQSRLSLAQLRRAEDAYVDELLEGAVALGVPLIAAHYGRAWLDLNRAADELDPAMFREAVPAPTPGDRVAAGLGVLPRIAAQGLDIYPAKLTLAEAQARLQQVHRPYHAMLTRLLQQAKARHGYALLIDCHSMPTPAPASGGVPEIVLGDLYGTSAAAAAMDVIEAAFAGAGLRVARNAPYAGGYTTARYGDPATGIHAVQVEIDRALYMDPARLQRHGGFATIRQTLTATVAALLDAAPQLGLAGTPRREAAE